MGELGVVVGIGIGLVVAGTLAVFFRRQIAHWNSTGLRAIFGRALGDFVSGNGSPVVLVVLGFVAVAFGGFLLFAASQLLGG